MSNTIHIKFFGSLTDVTKTAELTLHDDVQDTDALQRKVREQYPLLNSYTYVIAVDKKIIAGNTTLNSGQTIAFMPPFSGG